MTPSRIAWYAIAGIGVAGFVVVGVAGFQGWIAHGWGLILAQVALVIAETARRQARKLRRRSAAGIRPDGGRLRSAVPPRDALR